MTSLSSDRVAPGDVQGLAHGRPLEERPGRFDDVVHEGEVPLLGPVAVDL